MKSNAKTTIRLNKFLSQSGVTSRRKADELIANGLVRINGIVVKELGTTLDPENDKVEVDGTRVENRTRFSYYLFYKPKGVLSTMDDPLGRPTIADFAEPLGEGLYPVGRLDWDSEGLILLTNDGEFANQVTHPKWGVTKTYLVKVDGKPSDRDLEKLKNGVTIIGGKVSALVAERVRRGADKYDWIKIQIKEGKNRQVRRMFEKVGYDVIKLQRVAIGGLKVGSLDKGQIKRLNASGLRLLFSEGPDQEGTLKKKVRQKSLKRLPPSSSKTPKSKKDFKFKD
jgi:23S rRNA pseudouridine2605 synthase